MNDPDIYKKYLSMYMRFILGFLFQFIGLVAVCSVMSDSLRPHGLQHAKLLSPSLSPGVCSNSSPLSRYLNGT